MEALERPDWIVFDGGPYHGEHCIARSAPASGTFRVYAASATPGMRTPHHYEMTGAVRCGERDSWGTPRPPARVARFVAAMPDEPIPHPVYVWNHAVGIPTQKTEAA